jgi:hypothetical protein
MLPRGNLTDLRLSSRFVPHRTTKRELSEVRPKGTSVRLIRM